MRGNQLTAPGFQSLQAVLRLVLPDLQSVVKSGRLGRNAVDRHFAARRHAGGLSRIAGIRVVGVRQKAAVGQQALLNFADVLHDQLIKTMSTLQTHGGGNPDRLAHERGRAHHPRGAQRRVRHAHVTARQHQVIAIFRQQNPERDSVRPAIGHRGIIAERVVFVFVTTDGCGRLGGFGQQTAGRMQIHKPAAKGNLIRKHGLVQNVMLGH